MYLVPGVTPGQAGENLSGASTFNPRGASNFNALGHQANTNGWLIDGIDNNEYTFNTVIITPSVESVREFKVLTGVFSAEFGRGAGVVSVSTKSGSNEFHGTAFEFYRDEKYRRPQFLRRQVAHAAPKPPLDRNQFGGAIGGPVFRNRTFFFFDYAGLRETRGLAFVNTVPTAETRVGDFCNFRDRTGNLIPIYDPLTHAAEPGLQSGPAGQREQPAVPARSSSRATSSRPTASTLSGSMWRASTRCPTSRATSTTTSRRPTASPRTTTSPSAIDHRFGESDSIFFRYNWGSFKLDAPQGQAACCLRRRPMPPPASTSGRSWPASRTRG